MHYLDYNEPIQHGTPDKPIAYYSVDEKHPRYHMRMHWHIEYEIISVRSGRLELYVDENKVTAAAGDLIFLGKGAVHGGEPENCEYDCIVFDPGPLLLRVEACAQTLSPLLARCLKISTDDARISPLLGETARRLFDTMRSGDSLLMAVGCLFSLFSQLLQSDARAVVELSPPVDRRKAEQLKPALEYIESHYGQHITLDMLARLTGLSPKYFCRYFRAIVHRSPIDYLNFYRIECASNLLSSSDMTVAEVAYHCGFNDSSFFIKQFRRYKGTTPHSYRERLKLTSQPR